MHLLSRLSAISTLALVSGTLAVAQPAPQPAPLVNPDALNLLREGKPLPPGQQLINQNALDSLKLQLSESLDNNPVLLAMQDGDFRDFSFPGMHAESRIAPPGLWWRKQDIVQALGLTPDQQKRMDDIVQQNRIQLIDLKANLEKQQVIMEPLLSANPPDTRKVLEQIDRTAQARADLEKSNAKMLLALRGVLTADQWTKLQDSERQRSVRFFRQGGPRDDRSTPRPRGNPAPAPPPAPAAPTVQPTPPSGL